MTDELSERLKGAKQQLSKELRTFEGFEGIGVGMTEGHKSKLSIRVYVRSTQAPVAKYLRSHYGNKFHGYQVSMVKSDGFVAQVVDQKS